MRGEACIVLLACCLALSCAHNNNACSSDEDCEPGYCCVEHLGRYVKPSCSRMRQESEACRPGGPIRRDNSFFFPDGTELRTSQANVALCPCDVGLTCDRTRQACSIPAAATAAK